MKKDCVFCQIIKKKLPAEIEYEDKDVIAFKDINPQAPVHILIVPKKHIPSLNEFKDKDFRLISKIFKIAQKLAQKKGIQEGYQLHLNVGKKAGQVVFHFHLHLMGGWKNKCLKK